MSEPINPQALSASWKQHVEAWRNSGQSQKGFCQANELAYHRFVYWRRKGEGGVSRPARARVGGSFAAVVRAAPIDTGLTLSLPNGLVVRGICAANVGVVRALLDQFR